MLCLVYSYFLVAKTSLCRGFPFDDHQMAALTFENAAEPKGASCIIIIS